MNVSLVLSPSIFKRLPLNGLAYLAAYLRARGHTVKLFDLNVETESQHNNEESIWQEDGFIKKFIEDNKPVFDSYVRRLLDSGSDVIGFSIWASTKKLSLYLAERVKQADSRRLIVFGGPECSFSGEELIKHGFVDIVVCGEGEKTFSEMLVLLGSGKELDGCPGILHKKYGVVAPFTERTEIEDLDSLPFPDYSDFDLSKYKNDKSLPVSFSRGCVKRCSFCNTAATWKKFRHRSAENIFKEMKELAARYKHLIKFDIDDPALNTDIGLLSRLCDLLIADGFKLNWGGPAIIRKEMDAVLLKKMAKAGCDFIGYGLESGSQKIIDKIGKGFLVEDAAEVLKNTSAAGIKTIIGVIIGFPGETEEDFYQTMEFIKNNKPHIAWVHSPSECNFLKNTELWFNPGKFGAVHNYNGDWKSLDGQNTHKERQGRIKIFNEFLCNIGMSRMHYSEVYEEPASGGDQAGRGEN